MAQKKEIPDVPKPYEPRLGFDGRVESRLLMLGKNVRFEAQTGDDDGIIRDFNPKTGEEERRLSKICSFC